MYWLFIYALKNIFPHRLPLLNLNQKLVTTSQMSDPFDVPSGCIATNVQKKHFINVNFYKSMDVFMNA